MEEKSSFNLKPYSKKTGELCLDGNSECGTREASGNRKKSLARGRIFDDAIATNPQLLTEAKCAQKHGVQAAACLPPPDHHDFNGYRIERSRFTVASLSVILMFGVWLSLIFVRGGLTDYQIADSTDSDPSGLEVQVPDTNRTDEPRPPETDNALEEGSAATDNPKDPSDPSNPGGQSGGGGQFWAPLPTDDGTHKYIAFTFDDGPSSVTTPRLLNILARENVPATFFVIGNQAARNPAILARMAADGHVIGSHSWRHGDLSRMSSSSIVSDLARTANAIEAATGTPPTLLRPPYGSVSRTLQNTANLPLILWSIDTRDWQNKNTNTIYNIVAKNAKSGSIVLFHDIYPTTIAAVELLIPALKRAGYTFVTVPELLGQPLQNGRIYRGRL
ncbi:polysaccharide deacetylase family protein [Candidatus Saccharibacteria bacterium]|nr:polysaccharide deacetylase family protein [Candidatus Saccharibacteria bacterium]